MGRVPALKAKVEVERLEIRLLGELTVRRNGRPSPLPASKKTRALLAYLVATGRSHGREKLCEILWEVPDDPRGALRWSLSKLRPIVDGQGCKRLVADRDRVAFEVNGADVDLLGLRELSARGLEAASLEDLARAACRFEGPFLEGLDLPDCVQFLAWCLGEREQARALNVAVLKTLIARTRDTPDLALSHARALVALDPLAESSHLEVIRLLAAAGRTRDALEECDRSRRILEEQIGASPSVELDRLRASLRASRVGGRVAAEPSGGPSVARPMSPPMRSLALVGRTREREVLVGLARGGGLGGGLLVLGDSGLGKTRLLAELAGLILDQGGRVLQGRAFEAEGIRPYGVWLEALGGVPRETIADHLRTDLALLFPELGAAAVNADRPRLFDAILQLLRAAKGTAPRLAVLLDDLQWMDEASSALLHYLARATEQEPIVLACAARFGELEDNPAAFAVVRALEREHRMVRLHLDPLSPEETAALARQVSPAVDAQRVHAESEGNPLFALELARALSRKEVDASATLGRLVRDRLDGLGESEQAVLPWASALGRSFQASVLGRVSGLPPSQLIDGLERLERHAILRASGTGSYDFAHDVIRSAAYTRMSEPRRRLVHIQIARALWQGPARDETVGEVLHHAALAGEQELAARAAIEAGERCIRLFAYADARDLSRRGLGHASQLPVRVRLPLEVELIGLRARRPSGGEELSEIDGALERAARAAERAGLLEAAARALYFRLLVLYGGGDFIGALESAERLAEKGRGAGSRTAILHRLGSARCFAILERGMANVSRVLEEAADSLGPDPGAVDFYWTRGLMGRFLGDYPRAVRDLERAALQTSSEDRHWEYCWCVNALSLAELERGNLDEAARWAERAEEVAKRVGEGVERPAAAAIQALAKTYVDPRAWSAFARSLDDVRAADGKAVLSILANFAAERALAEGANDRAKEFAEEALVSATAVSQRSQAMVARALLAQHDLARGDLRAAALHLPELRAGLALGPWEASARARAAAERVQSDIAARLECGAEQQPHSG